LHHQRESIGSSAGELKSRNLCRTVIDRVVKVNHDDEHVVLRGRASSNLAPTCVVDHLHWHVARGPRGGDDSTGWHGFADIIFQENSRRGGSTPALESVANADYKTEAVRPADSQLDCTAFASRYDVRLRL
jgi:hypothetical protein